MTNDIAAILYSVAGNARNADAAARMAEVLNPDALAVAAVAATLDADDTVGADVARFATAARNEIARRDAAANVDILALLAATAEPQFGKGLFGR